MIDRNQINNILDEIERLTRIRDRMVSKMEPVAEEYRKAHAELATVHDQLQAEIAKLRNLTDQIG